MSNWASFFLKIWHDFFGKGILEGKVIDEKEQPLQQAIIRLNNKEEATTSIQGTFLFENLRGKYTISIVFQNIILENYDTIFIKGGDEKKIEIKLLQKYFPLPSTPLPPSETPIENPNQSLEQTTDTVTLPITPPPPSIDDSASEMEEAFYDEESFVTRLSSFSDKKWTEYYFELAEQIVNFNEIAHNDPMLAMTVPQKKKLPVSIGSRYVLCLGEKKKKNDEKLLYIGFIVDGEGATLKKGGNVLHVERFNGKTEQDRPYWIEVECSQDERTIDPSLIEAWLRAVRYEIQKKGRSPYQKNHNPFFYRAAKHPDYRKALFDRVFPNQPTNPPTQTNNVEIDTKPLLGVSGSILHVSLHEFSQVVSFLNHIYSFISTAVKPYTYGDSWMLCDANSERVFYDMGQNWAKTNNRKQDDRSLGEVGILPNMKLRIVRKIGVSDVDMKLHASMDTNPSKLEPANASVQDQKNSQDRLKHGVKFSPFKEIKHLPSSTPIHDPQYSRIVIKEIIKKTKARIQNELDWHPIIESWTFDYACVLRKSTWVFKNIEFGISYSAESKLGKRTIDKYDHRIGIRVQQPGENKASEDQREISAVIVEILRKNQIESILYDLGLTSPYITNSKRPNQWWPFNHQFPFEEETDPDKWVSSLEESLTSIARVFGPILGSFESGTV